MAQNCVLDEGGDGSGLIVTDEYIKLANLYEKFDKENGSFFPNRTVDSYHHIITFNNDIEYLSFSDRMSLIESKGYDFVMKFKTIYI